MNSPFCVLVVGGAGGFGRRLVQAILTTTDWSVVVCGRDRHRTQAAVDEFQAGCPLPRVSAAVFDARQCTPDQIRRTGAQVVVDTAGPFQIADYTLARAAIGAACPYIDISDARAFVSGFQDALDSAAVAAGVPVLTGASSTPCLSNAALDALTAGWTAIEQITVAIAPGNRGPRGLSVVQAILSYVGQDVRVFQGGRWTTLPGWGITRRSVIPGLGQLFLSLCETPDLDILPERFAVRDSALFLAALELPVLHLGLVVGSWIVQRRWLRSLLPFAVAARQAAVLVERLGSDRGGMLVQVSGQNATGDAVYASWSLVAEGGDGPCIPILPALAYMRRMAHGHAPAPGARAAVGDLSLDEIVAEMTPYRITTHRTTTPVPPSLFRQALAEDFAALPQPVQDLHTPGPLDVWEGRATTTGGKRVLGRLIARIVGFPPAMDDIPVRVVITSTNGQESWVRTFGTRRFQSRLRWPGTFHVFEERFGPLSFKVALESSPQGIRMRVQSWRCGIIPLPTCLMPTSTGIETMDRLGRFRFDVQIHLPLRLGRIVRYTGFLEKTPGGSCIVLP